MTSRAISQIEALSKRLEKARDIVARGAIRPIIGKPGHYAVDASDGRGFYLVNGECTCEDARRSADLTRGWCKHRLAVELHKETEPAPEPTPEPVTDRQAEEEAAKVERRAKLERDLDDLFR